MFAYGGKSFLATLPATRHTKLRSSCIFGGVRCAHDHEARLPGCNAALSSGLQPACITLFPRKAWFGLLPLETRVCNTGFNATSEAPQRSSSACFSFSCAAPFLNVSVRNIGSMSVMRKVTKSCHRTRLPNNPARADQSIIPCYSPSERNQWFTKYRHHSQNVAAQSLK